MMLTHVLNAVFNNTQNSYKYYWWLSIIEFTSEEQLEEINYEDIVLKTISKLWYPVNYFKLSFGKVDQCSKYVKEIQVKYNLQDNINESDLYLFLIKNKESDLLIKITKELTRYVPYRFIRTWYSEETRGLKDFVLNKKILELQNEKAPYYINYNSKKIIVNYEWKKWIIENFHLIKSFTLFELIKYLEKENPNVSNISRKLEKPASRNLTTQTKYWKNFIKNNPNQTDIFENKPLINLDKLSIDHFLPWSFMTHDLIWNLHPINKNINSSKSNYIPEKNYFKSFYSLQYNFCDFLLNKNLNSPLEDYYNLFNCSNEDLKTLSEEQFITRMDNFYLPQYEKSINMGFEINWKL